MPAAGVKEGALDPAVAPVETRGDLGVLFNDF